MYNDRTSLMQVLNLIAELKLQDTIILIGSWDEYLYEKIFEGYTATFRTLDTDFLIRRPVKTGKEFVRKMIEIGFSYEEDPMSGKSKFFKGDNEIEFLTTLTRGNDHIYKVPELGINAECLKYMDIPIKNLMPYVLENGSYILIPSPAAYCIHKILIHNERTVEKQQKDSVSIKNLLYSFERNNQFCNDFKRIYSDLGRKQKARVKENASIIGVESIVGRIIC